MPASRIPLQQAAIACWVALAGATPAAAFDFPIHVEITRGGLTAVVDNFIRSLPTQPTVRDDLTRAAGTRVMTFTPRALEEIADANKAQDTNDCGNKADLFMAARPCAAVIGGRLGERSAAFYHLFNEPPWEHFDGEQIQESSDYVLDARRQIQSLLKRGQFVGARKWLGRALHALQDFYSHTNYVELGYRSPNIDRRIGATLESFRMPGTRPRLAQKNEPTCLLGEYLFTNDLRLRLLAELKATAEDDFERRLRILNSINYLTQMLKDPSNQALTSGHFTLSETVAEPAAISGAGKCRHGFEQAGVNQAGIHKDTVDRPYHGEARTLATVHTTQFVVEIMRSILADPELESDEKYPLIAGLLGYEPTTMISSVSVGVPHAPNGDSWDTAIGSALGFFVAGTRGLKNIQPDILVCMESPTVPGLCLPLCDDADWSNELNAYVCTQGVNIGGWGTRAETDLRVLVREVDRGEPRRVIASFRVEDPRGCDPFCSLELEPGRTIWIRFDLKPMTEYAGPARGRAGLPPAAAVPVARPASATASPISGAGEPIVPSGSTSSSTSTAPSTARSLSPATAAAAPPLRTAEGIDYRLNLRDADTCTGPDAYFPASEPRSLSAPQLYQMAAFSMAITDATAKQAVLDAIRSTVGEDAFFSAMTAVIADPLQAQTLLTAYQNTARNVVQQITTTGLTSLLPAPKPASALLADVDRWVLSRLSSPALVAGAVDLMARAAAPLTAECAINELARQGFTDAVLQ